ncbi:MAG: hypothetical protein AABX38_01250 [Candidatus Micrarchaeota archaeon]
MSCPFHRTKPTIIIPEKQSNFSSLAVLAFASLLAVPLFAGGRREEKPFSKHAASEFCYDVNSFSVRKPSTAKQNADAIHLNIFNAPEDLVFPAIVTTQVGTNVTARIEGKTYSFSVCSSHKP